MGYLQFRLLVMRRTIIPTTSYPLRYTATRLISGSSRGNSNKSNMEGAIALGVACSLFGVLCYGDILTREQLVSNDIIVSSNYGLKNPFIVLLLSKDILDLDLNYNSFTTLKNSGIKSLVVSGDIQRKLRDTANISFNSNYFGPFDKISSNDNSILTNGATMCLINKEDFLYFGGIDRMNELYKIREQEQFRKQRLRIDDGSYMSLNISDNSEEVPLNFKLSPERTVIVNFSRDPNRDSYERVSNRQGLEGPFVIYDMDLTKCRDSEEAFSKIQDIAKQHAKYMGIGKENEGTIAR